jgi:Family of unknown function (DUF5681)
MTNSKDDDPVGYGRPPIQTRFQPGQSGNPRGRPRRRTIKADLRDALSETTGRSDGSTKQQILVRKLVDDAAGGDFASMKLLFSLTASLFRDESDLDNEEQIRPEHQALVDDFEDRQASANKSLPKKGVSND